MQELDVLLPRIDEHFDRIRANLIRCEECNENFFFDFLRHPRYFVAHFKTCHLKSVLYRFNGRSEEENQRVRFGPRRKKDATEWFGQLKSTEKRMISMQDNRWGEIAEKECWSCRLCKSTRKSSDMPHAFEPNELGRRQALLHLRQYHEAAYNGFMRSMPAVDISSTSPYDGLGLSGHWDLDSHLTLRAAGRAASAAETPQRNSEAERSRIRRMRATPEAKRAEAERSKRRREQLTPAKRQADAERRARKKQSEEERLRSRQRRSEASPEARAREVRRSRERRQNATEQQRQKEAERSRARRKNASEEQRMRERERCRRRYEAKKQQKMLAQLASTTLESEEQLNRSMMAMSENVTPLSASPSDFAAVPRPRVSSGDLERRSQELRQQQAGLGLQLQSLYASLAMPSQQMQL
ncbi:hypothetical protein PHYBOEH_007426 [Phytophthora boehmeriae]|uniref:Uncharacterized protein n=1 Tax=Phytophthora boehmeriae TaxID=109152 RepID=A0A8T1W895_9STRA|nr:hypothetical protein PHYBOEH_007426 [Phytophthora boehmeriae]